jgi:hypothetical protein
LAATLPKHRRVKQFAQLHDQTVRTAPCYIVCPQISTHRDDSALNVISNLLGLCYSHPVPGLPERLRVRVSVPSIICTIRQLLHCNNPSNHQQRLYLGF